MPNAAPTYKPPRVDAPVHQGLRKQHAIPGVQAQDVRKTQRWQRLRRLVLAQQPLCVDPYGQHGERPILAQQVDHILPLEARPDLAFVMANLQGLCTRCHARKSQAERYMSIGMVYLIGGPPAAGKSTWVFQRMQPGDMVLDLDRLLVALNGQDMTSPRDLQRQEYGQQLGYALVAYEAIITQIQRLPVPYNIYVITSLPDMARRAALAERLHAQVVMVVPPIAACLANIRTDPRRAPYEAQWRVVIGDWYREYEAQPHEA